MVPWITRLLVILAAITASFTTTHGTTNMNTAITTTKPGCQRQCGNLTVPYPFGIGFGNGCSINDWYGIRCDTSFNPPRGFLSDTVVELLEISETHMKIKNSVVETCYSNKTAFEDIDLKSASPYTISDTLNALFATGCDTIASFFVIQGVEIIKGGGCLTQCLNQEDVIGGTCSGVGCCKSPIPKGIKTYSLAVISSNNHTNVSSFSPCSHAFIGEVDSFIFQGVADISDPTFANRTEDSVPIALDWNVGNGSSCIQAQTPQNLSSYACQQNTNCTDVNLGPGGLGYRCSCLPGYEGNPYLNPGCTDIDECAAPINPCVHTNTCHNIAGDYECSCRKGQRGDGKINGNKCSPNNSQLAVKIVLGTSIGLLFIFIFISWIYFTIRKRKLLKMREKFFEQNGGLLLKQQHDSDQGQKESTKVFSAMELKSATNNYSEDRILGKGGYGTVYKGVLSDNRIVAIKKSKVSDQTQIEQFINEVVILTKINHRNVVKLLGCCLETEVPLLVYEYVSNGTLFEHIHKEGGKSWLTWANCLRIASEAADALSYLHSAASIPIIHRDIKSPNILLDDSYNAKISDFGASRLIPLDQTMVSTLVQGTMGYLDPEYFHTNQLTEKSDVYSFGVLLAELMTREKPLCMLRKMEERNLAGYFLMAMKEGKILEIFHSDLLQEADHEQLVYMANLIKSCLSIHSEDRPTMKEVAMELEGLKRHIKHPWAEKGNEEEIIGFTTQAQEDLYPINSSSHTATNSGQYNSIQMDMLMQMNHPR